ncbi:MULTISPECIES: hypothetical protein [Brasilonema]|uniref:hypothetical protein n=1 Tax=Brasilonema TaxID=383614 RepID=UPI00145FB21C|nr:MULTISPECIES: hypothetical protein [Brasilonema]
MTFQVILKVSRDQLLGNWFYPPGTPVARLRLKTPHATRRALSSPTKSALTHHEAHSTLLLCQSRENELILGNIAAASLVNTRRGKQRNLSLYLEGILGISSQNLK